MAAGRQGPARKDARQLAKTAVTGLVKPDDLIVQTSHRAIDWLFDRLPQKSRLERLINDVAAEIERLVEVEYRGQDVAVAVGNAIALFEHHGPSATDLIKLNLCPKRASSNLLERGAGLLATADEPVRRLCSEEIVPRVVQRLLGDPGLIEAIRPALYSTLLSRLDEIRNLQGDLGELLRRTAGRHLLIDPVQPLPVKWRDIHLLQAEHAIVPFHREARQDELRDLIDWCLAEEPAAVRLMTGPGGTGKTRLAMELCKELRSKDWRAGLLHRQMPDEPTWELDGLLAGDRPLLIVVDYAETRRGLVPLLERVAAPRDEPRRRILLLAREVAGWWPALQRATRTLQAFLDDAFVPVRRLQPIAPEPGERTAIVAGALKGFCSRLDLPAPDLPALDLTPPLYADALYLHIEALALLHGEETREVRTEDALLNFVLKRERRAWQEGLGALDGCPAGADGVMQLLALVTLRGGLTSRSEGFALAGNVPLLAEQTRRDVVKLAERLYPERAGAAAEGEAGAAGPRTVEPLRPDLIGEHLVDEALADDAERLLPVALAADLPDAALARALTVLTRLAARKPEAQHWLERALRIEPMRLIGPALQVVIETGEPLGDVLTDVIDPRELEALIPKRTIALASFAVQVMEKQRAQLHAQPKPWPDQIKAEAARIANNLANRLANVGRRQDALGPAEEAAYLYRKLAEQAPDAYRPDLAMALNNLANRLSEVGRRQDALEAAREAADLYRELAIKGPDAYRPGFATSLSNLAAFLSQVGRPKDALNFAKEAVDLYRELAKRAPDVYKPDLARSLNNLAVGLSGIGRRQDALGPAEQAVDLYRELAELAPDAYRPGLANSLSTLAIRLGEAARRQEALKLAEEAVELYSELANKVPDAYRPGLAMSLNNLATVLSEVGRRQDALRPAEEAIRVYRELADQAPDAYKPNLAASLTNLAISLSAVGRRQDALQVAEEAADLYRELAEQAPDAYRPNLAGSLTNLATCLSEVGRPQDALEAAREALEALAPHFLTLPEAYEPWMAKMVRNYINRCEEAEQEPDAELLGPIVEGLARLQNEAGTEPVQ